MKAIKNTEGRIIPRSCAVTEERAWKQACVIDSHMMRCMEDGYRCVEVEITELGEKAQPVAVVSIDRNPVLVGAVYNGKYHQGMRDDIKTVTWLKPVEEGTLLYAATPVPEGMVMVTSSVDELAELLHDAGWRPSCDAQYNGLARLVESLAAALKEVR